MFLFLRIKALHICDGFVHLMNDDGSTREDLRVPEGDLAKDIQMKFDNEEDFMVRLPNHVGDLWMLFVNG